MKVKIKFSVEQIVAINKLLNELYTLSFNNYNTMQKVQISIGVKLSDTFEKKKRGLYKKLDLLNANEKKSMEFLYHEAWALKELLINEIGILDNAFHKIQAQNAIDLLDEKIPSYE
ncbi:hypothetical protein SAMN04489761_3022 [Tenacibaculum sp. MAR_2009_124]|uniref:hypothetical protein n=1 Tax=Tenacibaculum sp. MAR_2009_124 TaxID=1250059 RepID=UPI0008945BF7|nr:hypothetical protein [Tenacibaculum sp. MAR_2009_124]SEC44882.1 hypothetical protein SAMN04489761_3022 [Tenacibaculum sp. MAR_2009_124]